jgi:hypothetical protein
MRDAKYKYDKALKAFKYKVLPWLKPQKMTEDEFAKHYMKMTGELLPSGYSRPDINLRDMTSREAKAINDVSAIRWGSSPRRWSNE